MKLLLVGASVRAAAFSALRAGLTPICADLFGDVDLQQHAEWIPLDKYPQGLLEVVHRFPGVPLIYTGGFENHPDLLREAARETVLLGNAPDAVRSSRDPFRTAAILQAAGLAALELRHIDDPPEQDGTWMYKPGNRAAGFGVTIWDEQTGGHPKVGCFQKRMPGQSCSAVFLSVPGKTLLLGMTEQLIGIFPWAEPFAWCGSIGPLQVGETVSETIHHMGTALAEGCGLRGLWGMDFLLDGDRVGMCEINPRYPASLELLEYASGLNMLDWHVQSLTTVIHPAVWADWQRQAREKLSQEVLGKLVLYSDHHQTIPEGLFPPNDPHSFPRYADIPAPGSEVQRGVPICTVFARGGNSLDCREALFREVRQLGLLREESEAELRSRLGL